MTPVAEGKKKQTNKNAPERTDSGETWVYIPTGAAATAARVNHEEPEKPLFLTAVTGSVRSS